MDICVNCKKYIGRRNSTHSCGYTLVNGVDCVTGSGEPTDWVHCIAYNKQGACHLYEPKNMEIEDD